MKKFPEKYLRANMPFVSASGSATVNRRSGRGVRGWLPSNPLPMSHSPLFVKYAQFIPIMKKYHEKYLRATMPFVSASGSATVNRRSGRGVRGWLPSNPLPMSHSPFFVKYAQLIPIMKKYPEKYLRATMPFVSASGSATVNRRSGRGAKGWLPWNPLPMSHSPLFMM